MGNKVELVKVDPLNDSVLFRGVFVLWTYYFDVKMVKAMKSNQWILIFECQLFGILYLTKAFN